MKALAKIILSFTLVLISTISLGQKGKVIEERTVKSAVLNRSVKYTIYLPADYETSERTYPVVYLYYYMDTLMIIQAGCNLERSSFS